jgi:hypothetical protein
MIPSILRPPKRKVNNATLKSLLLHARISSAVMTALNAQNLLLPPVQDCPVIMIKSDSILLHAQIGSATTAARIHVQNLLLLFIQKNLAITISSSLQLIVESFSNFLLPQSKGTHQ